MQPENSRRPRQVLSVTFTLPASGELPARERTVTVSLPRSTGPRRSMGERISLIGDGPLASEMVIEDRR
jgi:hypothetical protein